MEWIFCFRFILLGKGGRHDCCVLYINPNDKNSRIDKFTHLPLQVTVIAVQSVSWWLWQPHSRINECLETKQHLFVQYCHSENLQNPCHIPHPYIFKHSLLSVTKDSKNQNFHPSSDTQKKSGFQSKFQKRMWHIRSTSTRLWISTIHSSSFIPLHRTFILLALRINAILNRKIFLRYQTSTCTFMWFNNLFHRALLSTLLGLNCYVNNPFWRLIRNFSVLTS